MLFEKLKMERSLNLKKYPDFVKYQLPVLLWMAFIFGLSSVPGYDLEPIEFPYAHLIAHSLLYATLCALLFRALRFQHFSKLLSSASYVFSFLLVAAYGASDEYHQSFVPGRMEELKDFLIDVTSALVVLIIIFLVTKLRANKSKLESV